VRELQLAQPAWVEPPARPPAEGRVTGRRRAACQGLGSAFEGERISPAEPCGRRGLEGFGGLSQTASVKLPEELGVCVLRRA